MLFGLNLKKTKISLKNPTSGLEPGWATLSFGCGRSRGLNREIGQIWDGAASPRPQIGYSLNANQMADRPGQSDFARNAR